jgi:hypothetical protein
MSELVKPPDWPILRGEDGWTVALMSNFDHEVDEEVAEKLRTENARAEYPGWNFNAECWFADGQFHAAVRTYHVHRETFSADTPEELMELVSGRFGWAE